MVRIGRSAPDEERLVLSKPVVQFSLTYGVSRSIFMSSYILIGFRIIINQKKIDKVMNLKNRRNLKIYAIQYGTNSSTIKFRIKNSKQVNHCHHKYFLFMLKGAGKSLLK